MKEKVLKHMAAGRHVHNRILFQLIGFVLISIIMFIIIILDIVQQNINPLWPVIAVAVGLIIGWLASKIFAIQWHQNSQKVIMSVDRSSIILVVLYVMFRLVSTRIIGGFVHGDELAVITYSALVGILIGRGLSMLKKVFMILREQEIL